MSTRGYLFNFAAALTVLVLAILALVAAAGWRTSCITNVAEVAEQIEQYKAGQISWEEVDQYTYSDAEVCRSTYEDGSSFNRIGPVEIVGQP